MTCTTIGKSLWLVLLCAIIGAWSATAFAGDPPPNVTLPTIPACYGLPVDKDELLEQLRDMRTKAALNLPLGAEKGDPEMAAAQAQARSNVAAIDAAIKQAQATPFCPPFGKKTPVAPAPGGSAVSPPTDGVNTTPPPPPPGGGGGVKPDVKLPAIPHCFGLPVDKDELLQQLHDMRIKAALNLPLGAEKGDPEMAAAQAQADANVAAIDAAIKEAKETPYCPPFGKKKIKKGRKHTHKRALTEDNPLYMEHYQPPRHSTPSAPAEKSEPSEGSSYPPPSEPSDKPAEQPHAPDIPYQPPSTTPN